jgi:release factor glutamine methyltransferase
MELWTIQKLLNWTAGYFTDKRIDSPRISAELLLSSVLGLKRIELYTQFDKPVVKEQLNKLHELVRRAGEHEPIAYLTGKCEFYSLELAVTADCLIPRPETELLVARAIEFLRGRNGKQFGCDLCTGCGCVAVAIARNFADCKIIATDICDAALKVASRNIARYGLDNRIRLLCGDLFEPIIPHLDVEKFDLIACNPPYVSTVEYETLAKNVKDYEPKIALIAGTDGLDIHRRVIAAAGKFLKAGATLMLEIGNNQGSAVRELLETSGCYDSITIEKDQQKLDRLAVAVKKSGG